MGPEHQIVLDYAPSAAPGPRYGWGRPSHARLQALLATGHDGFRDVLRGFAAHTDALAAIDREVDPDSASPAWKNPFLPGLDGVALYCFVRDRAPATYLEVGSGNSTRFVARAKADAGLATRIVSIDPHPRAEVDALCDEVVREPAELVDPARLRDVVAGDVVFFDGSHRVFSNGDTTAFFLDVLPELPPGVLVGIHDIWLPDDYPESWTDRWYNEQYLLACLLLGGAPWLQTVLPAWYVSRHTELPSELEALWSSPALAGVERHGGAFWLQTVAV